MVKITSLYCKLIILAITLPIFAANALAIGIGPPRTTLDFTPNLVTDMDFLVVNTGTDPIDAILYVEGDLKQYITLDKSLLSLPPRTSDMFSAHIALPATIEPGTHDMRIGAVESQPGQGGTVGARAGVESQLFIIAPQIGKTIRATVSVGDVTFGSTATIHFEIKNIGNEAIDVMQAFSTISNAAGETIADLNSDPRTLQPGETISIDLTWKPETKGKYTVQSRITYDGKEEQLSSDFLVGEPSISVLNISVSPFAPGQIAKITTTVRNDWNQKLSGVYARIIVMDNGTIISSANSRNADIEPFSTENLEAFLETRDLETKQYNATIEVYFNDKYARRTFVLEPLSSSSTSDSGISTVAIILIISAASVAAIPWVIRKK